MNIQFIPSANCSPVGRYFINILIMEIDPEYLSSDTKKDVGVKFLRAYPIAQALALPLGKDKQRKACPRRLIM